MGGLGRSGGTPRLEGGAVEVIGQRGHLVLIQNTPLLEVEGGHQAVELAIADPLHPEGPIGGVLQLAQRGHHGGLVLGVMADPAGGGVELSAPLAHGGGHVARRALAAEDGLSVRGSHGQIALPVGRPHATRICRGDVNLHVQENGTHIGRDRHRLHDGSHFALQIHGA